MTDKNIVYVSMEQQEMKNLDDNLDDNSEDNKYPFDIYWEEQMRTVRRGYGHQARGNNTGNYFAFNSEENALRFGNIVEAMGLEYQLLAEGDNGTDCINENNK